MAPGASWDYQICAELCSSNLCCSTGSPNTLLITNRDLDMLKVVWEILPLQEKKSRSEWVAGATPASAYFGSAQQQCLVCFHAVFAERLKTSSLCSGKRIQKLRVLFNVYLFKILFEASRNGVSYPGWGSKSLSVMFQSWCFCGHHHLPMAKRVRVHWVITLWIVSACLPFL